MKKKIWIGAVAASAVVLIVTLALLLIPRHTDTVGICYMDGADSANTPYRQALKQALVSEGIRVVEVEADLDQAKQLSQIRQLCDAGCDLLLIEPVMVSAGPELKHALEEADLPAVFIGRLPDEACGSYPFVGYDRSYVGQLLSQLMLQLPDGGDINGDGSTAYCLICGPENHPYSLMYSNALQQALPDTASCLVTGNGICSKESGQEICRTQLATYGKDIEVIFCADDQLALGALDAIADGGRQVGRDVYLFGVGGDPGVLELVEAGKVSATVECHLSRLAGITAETVLSILHDTPQQTELPVPAAVFFTQE